MTNREKYAEQILDIACSGYKVALDKTTMEPVPCKDILCSYCYFGFKMGIKCNDACKEWCESEYEEPSIDWSKIPVDTPILVKDDENDEWIRRYYAGLSSEGMVKAWSGGRTSWSACDGERTYTTKWNYAKLAEDEE